MKILVAVKRVVDPYVKIRVKSDGSGIDLKNVKMSLNPFDEIAIEQALLMREQGIASEIVLVTVGSIESQETLRHGLALGADRAILVESTESFCSLNIAKILKAIVDREEPKIIIMGKQSIDGDNNQTPQMLAALLDWPQATYASDISGDINKLKITREVDGGLETVEVLLPAVISTDLRLNEPRYASLPNIMKAKQKPIERINIESLGLLLKPHIEILSVKAPLVRQGGMKLDTVSTLIDKLKNEAKVL